MIQLILIRTIPPQILTLWESSQPTWFVLWTAQHVGWEGRGEAGAHNDFLLIACHLNNLSQLL